MPVDVWASHSLSKLPGAQLIEVAHKVATVRAHVCEVLDKVLNGNEKAAANLRHVARELRDLDFGLQELEREFDQYFPRTEVKIMEMNISDPRRSIMEEQGLFDTIYTYEIATSPIGWNVWRSLRILVNNSLQDCQILLNDSDQSDATETILRDMIDGICRSIYALMSSETRGATKFDDRLSGIRGLFAVWPLKIAKSGGAIAPALFSAEQETWINTVITYLHRNQGMS